MKQPRRWFGGLSVTTAVMVCTLALAAWSRFDKMMEARDAWRDRATKLEEETRTLTSRANDEDIRDLSENAWRRNSQAQQQWVIEGLTDVMKHLDIKPRPGPYLEAVPQSVTSVRPPVIGPLPEGDADLALTGMVP